MLFYCVLYLLCDRLAAVDFYEFVINECQSHCCIEKIRKIFGKFYVQFEYIYTSLIFVNNGKGIKYFLVNIVMFWN